jgi:hypothetical protein
MEVELSGGKRSSRSIAPHQVRRSAFSPCIIQVVLGGIMEMQLGEREASCPAFCGRFAAVIEKRLGRVGIECLRELWRAAR